MKHRGIASLALALAFVLQAGSVSATPIEQFGELRASQITTSHSVDFTGEQGQAALGQQLRYVMADICPQTETFYPMDPDCRRKINRPIPMQRALVAVECGQPA